MTKKEYLDKTCEKFNCDEECPRTECWIREISSMAWDAAADATAYKAVNWINMHLAETSLADNEDLEALYNEFKEE